MKGLTEQGIMRLEKRGYKIVPVSSDEKSQKSFELQKNGVNILEIHFDSCGGETLDLDETSGTISVEGGYRYFNKLIGIYVTDEGVVLDYEDEKEKAKVVKETTEGWII